MKQTNSREGKSTVQHMVRVYSQCCRGLIFVSEDGGITLLQNAIIFLPYNTANIPDGGTLHISAQRTLNFACSRMLTNSLSAVEIRTLLYRVLRAME
jgi:hypothetical protein